MTENVRSADPPGMCPGHESHIFEHRHEPGHMIYWVSVCMLCGAVDWDDLDDEIRGLMLEGKRGRSWRKSQADRLLEAAWELIANAGREPGESKSPGWYEAAGRWRNDYFATLQSRRYWHPRRIRDRRR